MNCLQCKNLINTYIDGYLPKGQEQDVFRHIADCPECEQYYEDLMVIYDSMEEPEVEVPRAFHYAWRDEVHRTAQKKRKPNYKVLIPAFAACACGIVIMSIMVFGSGGYDNNNTNMLGQAFSLNYKAEFSESEAEQVPSLANEQQASGVAPFVTNEGDTVASPKTQQKSNGTGTIVEENAQGQGGQQGGAQSQHASANAASEDTVGGTVDPAAESAASVNGIAEEMPKIEVISESGQEKYVLDARGLNLDKDLLIEYAKNYNISVTETDNSIIIEANSLILESLLNFYNIKPISGMSKLEITLN